MAKMSFNILVKEKVYDVDDNDDHEDTSLFKHMVEVALESSD